MGLILLYAYLVATAIVVVRAAACAVSTLDRFDWKYQRLQICVTFFMLVLLWPLVLLTRPKMVLTPDFSDTSASAAKERAFHNLLHRPPPCSSRVLYRPDTGHGEFYFDADALAARVRSDIEQEESGYVEENEALLAWLDQRDNGSSVPAEVPGACSHFYWFADAAVRAGEAEIHCRACRAAVPTVSVVTRDDRGLRGWNSNRLLCPEGHLLLEYRATHIYAG